MRTLHSALFPLTSFVAAALPAQSTPPAAASSELGQGTRIEADDAPIDVTVGHAAPYLFDFDGDGARDLLVGEFGSGRFEDDRLPESTLQKWGPSAFSQGKLRIYKNQGTNAAPRFGGFEYLRARDQHASVPTT